MTQQEAIQDENLFQRLKLLNDVGVALSAKRDLDELLEMILLGAKDLTCADGGSIYRMTDNQTLAFEIVRTQSLGLSWGGKNQDPVPFPELPLYDSAGEPNDQMVVCHAALRKKTINIADAYNVENYNFSGTRQFDTKTGYRSKSFLTVPMMDNQGNVIGVLQLLNAIDPETKQIRPFTTEDQRIVESLASQAAMALTNGQLINRLNQMLEGFIEAMAKAIDEQSRFTANHCRRVPIIAKMLAEAISQTNEGTYKDFSFSEQDLYELNIAALLHDCGKIATPTHILDKATRQETVMDKIALIETRFAVLKRDLEIEWLKKKLSAERDMDLAQEKEWKLEYDSKVAALKEECGFLRESNHPNTHMCEDRQKHVEGVSKKTWRDIDGMEQPLILPEEMRNFRIQKGTLNDDERDQVNNHVVSTIKMLEGFPYPQHLERVPEIAGRHHEWVNGSGYPHQVKGDEMSVQARILAIADVFEALTAEDRPYRDPMEIEQALHSLEEMRDSGQLDSELVKVFIDENVAQRYAEEHLKREKALDME